VFKVNDYVIYSTMGVCKIVDIRKEKDINQNEVDHYVLCPAYGNNLTIKSPVNNDKVFMRKIMKREDVLSLIKSLPEQETHWISDDRKRNQVFKAALKNGRCEDWAKLVKTIYEEKQEKIANGKRLMKVDEEIMKAAEKNLYEEFAAALNIEPEEVEPFIMQYVS